MTAEKKLVQLPDNNFETSTPRTTREDEFLNGKDLNGVFQAAAIRSSKATRVEIEDLFRGKKWDDMLALFYPVTEKCPELAAAQQDGPIREKLGFALGCVQRIEYSGVGNPPLGGEYRVI